MEEQLINFETAKLAKEKGFDSQCLYFYTKPNSKMFGIDEHYRSYPIKNISKKLYKCGENAALNEESVFLAPTQSLLQKWLDITYNKYVHVEKHTRNGLKCYSPFIDNIPVKEAFFNDYDKSEEALEEGLQEALKLIKL